MACDVAEISVIAPVFNEEDGLLEFHRRVRVVLESTGLPWEVILVDDGSTDGSRALLEQLHAADPRCKVVHLSRNFGHQMALSAGLQFSTGQAVVLIDSDLQDPPELIPEMIRLWREGRDVVYAQRIAREGESWLKRATATAFYRVIESLSPVVIPRDTGDYRLMSRRVVRAINAMPERHRFLRGLVSWAGFSQVAIPYARDARGAGRTKFSLGRMVRFALDGITAFSYVPLQMATYFGFLVSGFSFLYILHVVWLKLFTDRPVLGWASLMVATTFLGGVQLLSLGIIGEYLGRIYEEIKGRPPYLVDRTRGLGADLDAGRTG